ncbi:MauE/DoxX family redox-associated membrane protein [Flavobacterium sp. W1B]|uniref:MauE/DoxX family redox-associated membrane protein n=1 Tax=Flavobacterium sp. W1B TaxID=3394146 RepID=UPI0039BC74A7
MKLNETIKSRIIETICLLYILLFVYAAVSKLLDFENFQVQLGQSPLLSAFAGPVSYIVLGIEFIIAVGLAIRRFRLVSLYASFGLMTMFTTYIIIILNFSPFVPCSCGGILEKLSWKNHLIFNVTFVLLAVTGVFLKSTVSKYTIRKHVYCLLLCLTGGTVLITVLFILSEDMMQHRNNFTRRFPHHPVEKYKTLDLKHSSHYIAGMGGGRIYLSNHNSPLTVSVLDTVLQSRQDFSIKVPDPDRLYKTLKVVVQPPYFYLADGTAPFIYWGHVRDWKASIWTEGTAYFNAFVPIDSGSIAIRALSSTTKEQLLGLLSRGDSTIVKLNDSLLEKQVDGIFDTGGMLNYNATLDKLVYTYRYRNTYFLTNSSLEGKQIGHTIDTTSRVRIKVQYVESIKGSKIASPAREVNRLTAIYKNYLFVNSAQIGQFEPREMWKKASIIDVYDCTDFSYVYSFYLHDRQQKKMRDFQVMDNKIVLLAGSHLVVYKMRKEIQ